MKKIVMFDTSYATQNMGDFIINEAINNQMKELLDNSFVVRYSTHTPIQKAYQNLRKNPINEFLGNADYKFLCGTNIFKENLIHIWNDFNIDLFDTKCYRNSIALGCGITKQKGGLNWYSKKIYKKILNPNIVHSVRDEATKEFLNKLGFSAINTGCPTFWGLNEKHCSKIPLEKSENVVFTLTDYEKNPDYDKKLISILKNNYKNIYFWVQGSNDYEYLKELDDGSSIGIIGPSLKQYKELLKKGNVDYVGTRLHAGVYAMQNFVRSIILIIDNRARDIKENYNINSIERDEIDTKLEKMINSSFKTEININEEAINEWKKQFIGGNK